MRFEKIQTIKICELNNYNFNIPNYQRGYRWTYRQITELLGDIYEFCTNGKNQNYYCIQPLVVMEKEKTINVIDGQQRLTTIDLILKALNQSLFNLSYERNDYLERITSISKKYIPDIDENNYQKEMAFGLKWNCAVLPLDIENAKLYEVKSGVIAVLFRSENVKFATLYIEDNYLIKIKDFENKLKFIRNKSASEVPVIIYKDNKYKDFASEFNNGNCTVISLEDFIKI